MQFVPVKSAEQQAALTLHRARDILVGQRTMLINAMRSHLAEFGIIACQGKLPFAGLVALVRDDEAGRLPDAVRMALRLLADQIDECTAKVEALERTIVGRHRANEVSRNLATIPGIGPIIASALAAATPDPAMFKSGRQFAAWLGLVPKQNSTGGKQRLGGITKAGDRYLRRLLVIGATGLIRYKRENVPGGLAWLTKLLGKKPVRLVTVALANKMARIAWAVMTSGQTYREVPMPQAA